MRTIVLAMTILLAGCAATSQYGGEGNTSQYSGDGNVMNNNYDGDFGPYFMVPTGGLAATAYWGLRYYNPWVERVPWGPWGSWGP